MKTLDAAKGKWKGILLQLGVDRAHLSGKHGPCPLCGGHDRFRFDNKHGNGSYICGQCGAGTGMQFLQTLNGWDFATAAGEVDKVLGNVSADPVKSEISDERRRKLLRELWKSSVALDGNDPASRYLNSRCQFVLCPDLRYVASCPAPDGVKRPALIAMVRDAEGNPANIHRTFLGPKGKADMENPRAMMPGPIPDGSAVRLFPQAEVLGVAEGIETAYEAAAKFGLGVWSTINSGGLAKWLAPKGVAGVMVFGDNDPKYGGQAAAYQCAHKNAVKGREVEVHIPLREGTDWADK